MIDRMRRTGMTRIVALSLIGLMSTAPAQAVDVAGSPRLQSLEQAVAESFDDTVTGPQAPDRTYEAAGQGEASYYGAAFAGNRTASGERFDPGALTCAHR